MFKEFYDAPWQFPWAVSLIPGLFLIYLQVKCMSISSSSKSGAIDLFVRRWCLCFSLTSILDATLTSSLVSPFLTPSLSLGVCIFFVLLGDFKIYFLIWRLRSDRQSSIESAAAAFAISIGVLCVDSIFVKIGTPIATIWLLHELFSVATISLVGAIVVPQKEEDESSNSRSMIRRNVLIMFTSYYVLWATSDILVANGFDAGWALRIVPNFLYYSFTIPAVWFSQST